MNIILVSNRFAKARSITLTGTHFAVVAVLAMGLFLAAVLTVQYAIVRFQPGAVSNELRTWLASAQEAEQQKQQAYLRKSLDAMAMRLGQMQAQLQRNPSQGSDLGYQLLAESGGHQLAQANWQGEHVTLGGGIARRNGDIEKRASASGGFALLDGSFFASRRIDGGSAGGTRLQFGSSFITDAMTSDAVSPTKACRPVSISNRTQPSE